MPSIAATTATATINDEIVNRTPDGRMAGELPAPHTFSIRSRFPYRRALDCLRQLDFTRSAPPPSEPIGRDESTSRHLRSWEVEHQLMKLNEETKKPGDLKIRKSNKENEDLGGASSGSLRLRAVPAFLPSLLML